MHGTRAFIICLAHMVGGILRRPEEVAGALAEELLGLYRDAAAVTIVRQTPATIPARILVAAGASATGKDGRSGTAPRPRTAAKPGDEEAPTTFEEKSLVPNTNGHAG